ncbi:MAG: serine hydrolase [Myxococcales bacterium]|nr:serine hydrolase [Myxococcales bacterium]
MGFLLRPNEHTEPVARLASPDTDQAPTLTPQGTLRRGGYPFVTPLLDCDSAPVGHASALGAMRDRLLTSVQRFRAAGTATHISVYVRDLDNGAWFGINEETAFAPASLMKVPILIALLVQEEMEPGYVQQPVFYPNDMPFNRPQHIVPGERIVPGRNWPLWDVAEAMIIESDNNALHLLRSIVPPQTVNRVINDLGLVGRRGRDDGDPDALSVRTYATVFRVLYNASYLGPGTSNDALEMLSRSSFRRALVAGVPEQITVAHKFGEWDQHFRDYNARQLHDCGIVYLPGRPYLACIMTRGPEQEPLIGVVADISKQIFEEFARIAAPN